MRWSGSYDELQQYLRCFINFGDGDGDYDFNGVLHLMLALLDNMRENATDADLKDIRESLTGEQAAFIIQMSNCIREGVELAGQRPAKIVRPGGGYG